MPSDKAIEAAARAHSPQAWRAIDTWVEHHANDDPSHPYAPNVYATKAEHLAAMKRAFAAAAPFMDEGWVMVPREPTEVMLRSAWDALHGDDGEDPAEHWASASDDMKREWSEHAARFFRAMIAAAPPLPPEG